MKTTITYCEKKKTWVDEKGEKVSRKILNQIGFELKPGQYAQIGLVKDLGKPQSAQNRRPKLVC